MTSPLNPVPEKTPALGVPQHLAHLTPLLGFGPRLQHAGEAPGFQGRIARPPDDPSGGSARSYDAMAGGLFSRDAKLDEASLARGVYEAQVRKKFGNRH